MIDLMSVGYLGRVFLVCRGIAGGILKDESPVVVDRLAHLIHNGEAACPECLGMGLLGDLGRCDGCRGSGVDPEVVASLLAPSTEPGEVPAEADDYSRRLEAAERAEAEAFYAGHTPGSLAAFHNEETATNPEGWQWV